MLVLKNAKIFRNFASTLRSFRCKPNARNFGNTVNNQSKTNVQPTQSHIFWTNHIAPLSPYMTPEMESKGAEYMLVYPDLIRELTDFSEFTLKPNAFKEAEEHFIKMMDHTMSGGHRDTMLMVVKMYKDLMGNEAITAENIRQAYLLGWSTELILSAYLILDDLIDNAHIRRGKTCWHKMKGMGEIAMNDMLMLENGCYLIIKRFFGHLPCYAAMMQTFTETFMTSLMGHSLDIQLNKIGVDGFRLENFNYAAIMAASYIRFYTPAALSMLLAGYDLNGDKRFFDALKIITHEIGPYFQAQNDFLDTFGDQSLLNKPPQDIETGKFSWCAIIAMKFGTEQQKDVMRKCYGKNDTDCVAKVKQVYDDICLPEIFHDYKKRNYNNVQCKINQLLQSDDTLKNACITFFDQAYTHLPRKSNYM